MSGHSSGEHHRSPPSAAGHLEPYGVRVQLRTGYAPLEAPAFLKDLLEGVAAACVGEGATVIGHLKCVLHTEGGPLACNLTSVRTGAACRGDAGRTIAAGEEGTLDLAVMVYGIGAETIEGLVAAVLAGLLDPAGVAWSRTSAIHSDHA